MNFSDIKTQTLAPPTLESVAALRDLTFRKARELLQAAVPARLHPAKFQELCTLLGLRRAVTNHASNLLTMKRVHAAIGESLIEAWLELQPRHLWLVTFTPDQWLIDEITPTLRLEHAHRESPNWLRALGLSGLGMFELAPFLNHPAAAEGRLLALHLHFLGIADDETTLSERVRSFNEAHQAKCSIGAFVTAKRITPEVGHVNKATTYGAKPLFSSKRVTPSRDKEGAYKLRAAPLPAQLALRVAELTSYVRPAQLIITRHSSAWPWRQRILEMAGLSAGPKQPPMLDKDQLDRLWSAVWRAAGERRYERVQMS
jgi:hypothetical protein